MSRPVSVVEKKMQARIGYIKVQNDKRAFFAGPLKANNEAKSK